MSDIGDVDYSSSKLTQAMDQYNQALPIEREVGDRRHEGITIANIGTVYWASGKSETALGYYDQALPIEREVGDRESEAWTLQAKATAYQYLEQLQKALTVYAEALLVEREVLDRSDEGITLHNIGMLYEEIGQPRKALQYYLQALRLEKSVGDRRLQAGTMSDIASVYDRLKQTQRALVLYEQELSIQQNISDVIGAAITLHAIGAIYQDIGQPLLAKRYWTRALSLEVKAGDQLSEAYTRWKLASLSQENPVPGYLEALYLARQAKSLALQGLINDSLMKYFRARREMGTAVLFGKDAVNEYQQIRENLGDENRALQSSFVKSKSDTYRLLAKLLFQLGRIPEAEHVVRMLKEEEYSEFTQGTRSGDSPSDVSTLSQAENQAESVTADEIELVGLRKSDPKNPEIDVLAARLEQSNHDFRVNLANLLARETVKKDVDHDTQSMKNILKEVQDRSPNTVGVYTLVLDKELDLGRVHTSAALR